MLDAAVKQAIETVVRAHVRSGTVVRVIVDDADAMGDDTLAVSVIFRAKKNALDADETSQLTRLVWQALVDRGVDQFPVLDFISTSDAGKLAAA